MDMAFYANGERTLEKYKIFPYIAWTLIIGFSLFVVSLTMHVKETAENFRYTKHNYSSNAAETTSNSPLDTADNSD